MFTLNKIIVKCEMLDDVPYLRALRSVNEWSTNRKCCSSLFVLTKYSVSLPTCFGSISFYVCELQYRNSHRRTRLVLTCIDRTSLVEYNFYKCFVVDTIKSATFPSASYSVVLLLFISSRQQELTQPKTTPTILMSHSTIRILHFQPFRLLYLICNNVKFNKNVDA